MSDVSPEALDEAVTMNADALLVGFLDLLFKILRLSRVLQSGAIDTNSLIRGGGVASKSCKSFIATHNISKA